MKSKLLSQLHFFSLLLIFPTYGMTQPPVLSASTELATAGNYQLSWNSSQSNASFELQESTKTNFADAKTLYQGQDTASFISGRRNGSYFYRVRTSEDQTWSDSVLVTVKHHSLTKAFGFFFIGLFVFTCTLLFIIFGNKRLAQ